MRGTNNMNGGMVSDFEEMRQFIDYLNNIMDEHKLCMERTWESLWQMQSVGFSDVTFKYFKEDYERFVVIINELNDRLKDAKAHYDELSRIIKYHPGYPRLISGKPRYPRRRN